jgi:sugar lactone lactonase YvrE
LLHDQQYSIGTGWKHMHQWSLTTAFDLSTASYDGSFSTGQEAFPRWNDDGTVLYTFQGNTLVVRQTVINVPYDLYGSTSRTSSNAITLSEPTNGRLQGNFFNSDGTKWATTDNTAIYVYDLSTAYDISTATFDTSITNAHNGSNQIWDMVGNPDGTAFFETANNNHGLKRYDIAGTNYTTTLDCENANVFETVLDASTTVVFSNPPASGTPVVTGYQLGSAAYDSKSFSVSSQESSPSGITFNTNGTKMFIVGYGGDEVNEYDLTTSFDVSTSTYSQTFSVSAQATEPTGIAFNSDGTKMFILDISGLDVNEYALTTGFDISTASYSQNFSVSSQESNPQGIAFNTDGTKMFVVGLSGDDVNEYTLTTGFDVSTASYSQNFSVSSQETSPTGVQFNADGTKMYIIGLVGDDVNEYTLTTGFDVSTASYTQNFSVASQETNPYDLVFSADGTKMFVVGGNTTVYQYSTAATAYSTTFDCENANVFETELDANTTVVFSNPPASGTPVVTGYDLSIASYDSVSFSVATQETNPAGIAFNSDGTKVFIVGQNGVDVNEYALSTAFDISTASYSQNFSVASQESQPQSLTFNTDGTKMFVIGNSGDDVNEYTLSTGFDISTASYSQNFSVATEDTDPRDVAFNTDGTKMFIAGNAGDDINEYALTTGFDISTASYTQNFSVAPQEITPVNVTFNSDGTKMFVIGQTGDDVNEYTLSTGFDLSTASYSQNFSVSSQDTTPSGIAFNTDGTKMYIVGDANNSIYQYTTGTTSLNDSTAYAMSLKVVQDSGASGYTVTWPTSVDWPSATAPTLTATASAVDQFVFYTYDGGTTWYGFTAGQALG